MLSYKPHRYTVTEDIPTITYQKSPYKVKELPNKVIEEYISEEIPTVGQILAEIVPLIPEKTKREEIEAIIREMLPTDYVTEEKLEKVLEKLEEKDDFSIKNTSD
jgi:hypothetical protein